MAGDRPAVTIAIMAVCILAWFGMSSQSGFGSAGGRVFVDGALFGPAVAAGDWWRLITSGFLHDGLIHLGFNMYILWWLGGMLEPLLGRYRFAALYFASMLAGSFGALLIEPNAATIGASGAVFGLMGAAIVMGRSRGIDPMQSGLLPLLLLNLAITFFPGFNISIGGHIGGLVGGAIAGLAIDQLAKVRRGAAPGLIVCAVIGAAAVAGSFAIV
jgi:membrane associated rhomboid family serine protease